MRVWYAAVVAVPALTAVGANAQSLQPVAQTVAVPMAAAPSAGLPGQAVLRNGTPVPLRLMETLTTRGKMLRAGYRFRLETAAAVTVDGQVVIPLGSSAVGEITEVRNKGMWGKSGKFAGRILYVNVNGRQVRVSGQLDDKGTAGGAGAVAVSALVFLPAGFFMTGTSASLPIGAPVQAFVEEDVAFAFGPTPVPTTVGAPTAFAASMPARSYAPVVAQQPVATTQFASVQTVAQPVGGMSLSAQRYAQRDEYIRLVGQMGLSPAAAMAAVERKYGIAME